jgi:nicotinamidase-related amidase
VEYRPRAFEIMRTQFSPLLQAARQANVAVIHVTGCGSYYQNYPGFQKTLDLMPPTAQPVSEPRAPADPLLEKISAMKDQYSFVGAHNLADVSAGFKTLDFGEETKPAGDEYIVENGGQLNAVCQHLGISHLIYMGFAINWCILMSPGGMMDMSRKGYFCSAIRQAVTAVENQESARTEAHKEEGLWRTALAFGLVFDADAVMGALGR